MILSMILQSSIKETMRLSACGHAQAGIVPPHLLHYRVLAVKDHSFIPCASHLQQPRLVNNSGYNT